MKTAIWWIRRDLRLDDNPALHSAQTNAQHVLPVFILDPAILNSPNISEKRLAFLFKNLRRLEENLQERGSRLVIRRGMPKQELARLVHETKAGAIYAQADYTPYASQRDAQIALEFPLHLVEGVTIRPPDLIRKSDGAPYTVFTPYSKAWKSFPPPQDFQLLVAPAYIPTSAQDIYTLPLPYTPALPAGVSFIPGEQEARRRLDNFLQSGAIYGYERDRNMMGIEGTSRLSPYLRFGILSPRRAASAAYQAIQNAPDLGARKNAESWLNELIWREFYIAVIYHFPHVRTKSFRATMQDISWENDLTAFHAWKNGLTGYPIVDAAMREMASTGWMHNRARMITASFLVKHLLIDWRWGEKWFMQNLLDGDLAVNNGGWQWSAGTGTDAAPYFRIFNPVLQGEKFDPHGDYVRRWIPELASLPNNFIHKPWEMPPSLQKEAHCLIGQDYPAPIVEHNWARRRALEVYKQIKGMPA